VSRLEPHRDAACPGELLQPVGDLLAKALLHGESARVDPEESGQLRDAEDLPDVAFVALPLLSSDLPRDGVDFAGSEFDDVSQVTSLSRGDDTAPASLARSVRA
jgi:hypothetical protein